MKRYKATISFDVEDTNLLQAVDKLAMIINSIEERIDIKIHSEQIEIKED